MAVLKQTSPTAWPVAPSPMPSSTVPSASTSSAVTFGSVQEEVPEDVPGEVSAGCFSLIAGLNLGAAPPGCRFDSRAANFVKGHSRAARRDQHCPQGRHESPRRAPRIDAAAGECCDQERRYRGGNRQEGCALRRRPPPAAAEADQAAPGGGRDLRQG